LRTIAQQLGLSTASVSHAFNRPDRVSAHLRARVLAEAARQGYPGPDPAARQLRRGRADALGLVFTSELSFAFRDPAAVGFLEGLARSCEGAGLNLLVISAQDAPGARDVDAVRNAVIDGFVVYSLRDGDPHLAAVLERKLPTVVVDAPEQAGTADWVGLDDRASARALGEYLRQLGHRRVGIIIARLSADRHCGPAGPDRWAHGSSSVGRNRILGLHDGLATPDHPAVPVEEHIENSPRAGADALHALLDRHPDLTAVCCLSDVLAVGALAAAAQRGLRVPEDLTITGFDGIAEAERAGISTVSQPLVDKGRIAGELYLSADASRRIGRRRVLPTVLEVRRTSGPPASR
jgi:DNA-binding LacI/PurR family transcriptional regulator